MSDANRPRKFYVRLPLSSDPVDAEIRREKRRALGMMRDAGYHPDPETLKHVRESDAREDVTCRLPGRRNSAPVYETRSVIVRTYWGFTATEFPAPPESYAKEADHVL